MKANQPSSPWCGSLLPVFVLGCCLISDAFGNDPLVVYTFEGKNDTVIEDQSGVEPAVNLQIENPESVRRDPGRITILSAARIRSTGPATKLIDAIKRTGEVSVEIWMRPLNLKQEGPARIVTVSETPVSRNLTIGQEADRFDARLRSTKTSANGIPSLQSPKNAVRTSLTHLVYLRDRTGQARLFVDGRQVASRKVAGNLSNWGDFRLALGDELSGGRPWLGELHRVAIGARSLSPAEVVARFRGGPQGQSAESLAEARRVRHFENRVAPLLARYCLDCHDTAVRNGELDLTRQKTAMAGGENGPVIIPGKAGESRLWKLVDANEMPPESDGLNDRDKQVLAEWINGGAVWSLTAIDPAVYATRSSREIWIQRLTVDEYIETVRSTVGVDIAKDAREILPPDVRADGFSNTAYNLTIDFEHVEAYARLAEIIVSRLDAVSFARRFSKSRSLSTDDTMRDFVAAMGKHFFRGPLTDREVSNYSGIATTVASAGGDYKEAVTLLLEAMLQSPRFIYRIENQRGDGSSWPVGPFELASRLSYVMWGAPPDDALMKAADSGQLLDRKRLLEEVDRMLADQRAIDRSVDFISEWLNLKRLQNLKPSVKRFPKWDAALAGDMEAETIAFFKDVVWKQQRPLSHLFNAQVTFATPRLAHHYGLPKKEGDGLLRYDLAKVPERGGLLTQGSVLTVGGDDASMVTRGLFIMHDVLRGVVKDPPPGVDTTPVPAKPGLSHRTIAEQRMARESCGGCHAKFEPLAFGLEKYDGLGGFHETDEHGNTLREDGEILIPGLAKRRSYATAGELMDALAASDRVSLTLTWKVAQFAAGRPLGAEDVRIVEGIHRQAQDAGGTYSSVMKAIALSDLILLAPTEARE